MTRFLVLSLALLWAAAAARAELPDPAAGGKGGGPIDLLLLRGHAEMNFGRQPPLDETYQNMLRDRGYRVTTVAEWERLSLDYLRQFNTVVYLNPSPYLGGGYFDMTFWRSGAHLLTVRDNLEVLRRHVSEGGGLLIVPALEEICMRTAESLKALLVPYGMDTACACVRDMDHAFEVAKVIGVFPVHYCWTEKLAAHPVTAGCRRVYYPAYCTRWDDNYTTIPLFPRDPAWIPFVQSMPGTKSMWLRGTIYDPGSAWSVAEGLADPAVLAGRDYGKGRIAVTGISPFHLFYLTYSKEGAFAEANYVKVDGIAMERGDGQVPSDLHRVLDNLYRWLAEASLRAGMGGYDAANGVRPGPPADCNPNSYLSDVWAGEGDPMITGPVRPMKILVGARSDISDGKGAPADWARAAREAGCDVVCFTETFEHLNKDRWPAYVAECARLSGEQVALLPGLDMDTDLDNRFLIVGYSAPIRSHILTEDGKRLMWTGHMLLGMGDVLPVAARPQRLAAAREKGGLPPDLYSHCPGVAVGTWREGRQVDDGLFAYEWHLYNGTIPIPVAVHEVYAPADLAAACAAGLQNYVNSDTPAHAAFYYRQGHASFGGNPMRYYVSSGPLVDHCRIDDWQSPHWQVALRAHGEKPITEVLVRDRQRLYRRLAPGAERVDVAWSGNLGVQRWFLVELRDSAGGRALLSPIRTLPLNNVVRCMDRQNWFSSLHFTEVTYTGRTRSATAGPNVVGVPGVQLAADWCPKLQWLYSGEGFCIHEFRYDSTLVPGGRATGADNSPIFNELPVPQFEGARRFVTFLQPGARAREFREFISDITLKQDLTPAGDVWPVVGSAGKAPRYAYNDARTGELVEGQVPENGFADLPAGALVGDLFLLTPQRVGGAGAVGFAPGRDAGKAGARFHARMLQIKPDQAAEVRKAWGFDGEPPFRLDMAQGRLERTAFWLHMTAQKGGAAGKLAAGKSPILGTLPVMLAGANPRWPVGVWQAGGVLRVYDFLGDTALGRLDVGAEGPFYVGNLLTATDPDLNLAIASDWTVAGVTIEVNNPTDRPIEANVASPAAITDRKPVSVRLMVPAGATVYREIR